MRRAERTKATEREAWGDERGANDAWECERGDADAATRRLADALTSLLDGRRPVARERARALAGDVGVRSLAVARAPELLALGASPREVERIRAAVALGRQVLEARVARRPSMRSARSVYELVAPRLAGLEQEAFVALLLDGKHRLVDLVPISLGTATMSLVHPREVYRPAIRAAASALVVAHNHPSGDPEPSAEDLAVTRRLDRAGTLLGIPLLDHVVVGAGRFVSLRERLPLGAAAPDTAVVRTG